MHDEGATTKQTPQKGENGVARLKRTHARYPSSLVGSFGAPVCAFSTAHQKHTSDTKKLDGTFQPHPS